MKSKACLKYFVHDGRRSNDTHVSLVSISQVSLSDLQDINILSNLQHLFSY